VVISRDDRYESMPLAYYDKKRHWVKLYEYGFKKIGSPQLMGQFYELFDTHTPFTKVSIDPTRAEYTSLARKLGVDINHMPF
jgi:hypothetical protein